MALRFLFLAAAFVFLAAPARAQPVGDATQGQKIVDRLCIECHAVSDEKTGHRINQAASFQTIANTPGMTPLALSVWFRTPHREMPNIILSKDEQEDLIAFITSLKSTN